MKKIIIVLAIILVIFFAFEIFTYNPNNITNEIENEVNSDPIANNSNSKISFIYSTDEHIIYGLRENGDVIELAKTHPSYKTYDDYNNSLYYIAPDKVLHSISLDTLKDTALDITFDNTVWDICVWENTLISFNCVNHEFIQFKYDLTTKEKTQLPQIGQNKEYYYNNFYYYSEVDTNDLYRYNFGTEEKELINKKSRIILGRNEKLLCTDEKTFFIYDTVKNEKIPVEIDDPYHDFPITLIENDVFYINYDEDLFTYSNGENKKLISLKTPEFPHSTYGIISLNNNELLIIQQGLEFDPEGYEGTTIGFISYIYNTKTNTLTKQETDYSIIKNSVAVSDYLYVK